MIKQLVSLAACSMAVALAACSSGGADAPISSSDFSPCRADRLTVVQDGYFVETNFEGTPEGNMKHGMVIKSTAPQPCSMRTFDELILSDAEGSVFSIDVRNGSSYTLRTRNLSGDADIYKAFRWDNWCGEVRKGPLHMTVVLPGDQGELSWTVIDSTDEAGNIVTPPCIDETEESIVTTSFYFVAGRYGPEETPCGPPDFCLPTRTD